MDMERSVACYRRWIAGQEAGLAELEAASTNAAAGTATDAELRAVVERCMVAYQDYVAARRAVSPRDGTAFISPPWCTAFERSMLWLGGCRPSVAIRLFYNLSGEGLEAQLEEFVNDEGPLPRGSMGVTPGQMVLVTDLHRRTLRQENALSDRLATLHEDVADRPLFPIVRQRAQLRGAAAAAGGGGGCDGPVVGVAAGGVAGGGVVVDAEVDASLSRYKAGLAQLVAEADELRVATARAMATEILTPRQAVEMLAAAKQLHLSVRDWSRRAEGAAGAEPQRNGPRAAVAAASTSAARRNP
ncbi:unnamed protein product [Urochloa decumbens]|uniref:DOG1 domain-containing protein n=1 Tax=Urochloa decumbens TaxID=240449 RepID=A0ABC9HB78_9POAL